MGLDWVLWALFVVYILLHVGDVITTNRVLAAGGFESNFFLRWIMKHTGRFWWIPKILLGVSAGAVCLFVQPTGVGLSVLSFLVAFYTWVVTHNLRLCK